MGKRKCDVSDHPRTSRLRARQQSIELRLGRRTLYFGSGAGPDRISTRVGTIGIRTGSNRGGPIGLRSRTRKRCEEPRSKRAGESHASTSKLRARTRLGPANDLCPGRWTGARRCHVGVPVEYGQFLRQRTWRSRSLTWPAVTVQLFLVRLYLPTDSFVNIFLTGNRGWERDGFVYFYFLDSYERHSVGEWEEKFICHRHGAITWDTVSFW